MLKYLFITIYGSIAKSIQKPVRTSRTRALVSYLLSFWLINFILIFFILFDVKNKIYDINKLVVIIIVIFIFIPMYFLSEWYYRKDGRGKSYIDIYESYNEGKHKWLRFVAFLIMIGTITLFGYLGLTF